MSRFYAPDSYLVSKQTTNKQTNKQTDKQTNKQTNRQTDRQTNKQTNRQTNKQTNRQTNKFVYNYTIPCCLQGRSPHTQSNSHQLDGSVGWAISNQSSRSRNTSGCANRFIYTFSHLYMYTYTLSHLPLVPEISYQSVLPLTQLRILFQSSNIHLTPS